MKKIVGVILMLLVILPAVSQVKSKIQTRTGYKNQLEIYGRVAYHGLLYSRTGKDSLLVQNDAKMDSVIIPPVLTIDNKSYTVAGFKDNAFEYDVDLKYISIPTSITEIASSCFYGCSRLRECEMTGVEIIGPFSFFRTAFTRLIFHEGLTRIEDSAFTECHQLEYIELPASLEYIGEDAFLGCDELTTVKVNFSEPIALGSDVFWLYRPNRQRDHKTLLVPPGSKEAFQNHPQWRLFQTIEEY